MKASEFHFNELEFDRATGKDIREAVRDLLKHNYVPREHVKQVFSKRVSYEVSSIYEVISNNFDFINELLYHLGFDLRHNDNYYFLEADTTRDETIFRHDFIRVLLVLYRLRHEKMLESGFADPVTSMSEIREKGETWGFLTDKLADNRWIDIMRSLARYRIISYNGSAKGLCDDDWIYIYPCINSVLTPVTFKAITEKFAELIEDADEGDTDNKKTEDTNQTEAETTEVYEEEENSDDL